LSYKLITAALLICKTLPKAGASRQQHSELSITAIKLLLKISFLYFKMIFYIFRIQKE